MRKVLVVWSSAAVTIGRCVRSSHSRKNPPVKESPGWSRHSCRDWKNPSVCRTDDCCLQIGGCISHQFNETRAQVKEQVVVLLVAVTDHESRCLGGRQRSGLDDKHKEEKLAFRSVVDLSAPGGISECVVQCYACCLSAGQGVLPNSSRFRRERSASANPSMQVEPVVHQSGRDPVGWHSAHAVLLSGCTTIALFARANLWLARKQLLGSTGTVGPKYDEGDVNDGVRRTGRSLSMKSEPYRSKTIHLTADRQTYAVQFVQTPTCSGRP